MGHKSQTEQQLKFGQLSTKVDLTKLGEAMIVEQKIQKTSPEIAQMNPFKAGVNNSNNLSKEQKIGQRYNTPSFTAFGEPIKKKSKCC